MTHFTWNLRRWEYSNKSRIKEGIHIKKMLGSGSPNWIRMHTFGLQITTGDTKIFEVSTTRSFVASTTQPVSLPATIYNTWSHSLKHNKEGCICAKCFLKQTPHVEHLSFETFDLKLAYETTDFPAKILVRKTHLCSCGALLLCLLWVCKMYTLI
jgi:hypothetical protein